MIKIDTNKIENWDFIVECHKIFFEKYVKDKFEEINYRDNPIYHSFSTFINKLLQSNIATGKLSDLKSLFEEYDKIIDTEYRNIVSQHLGESELEKMLNYIKSDISKFDDERKKLFNKIFSYDKFVGNKNDIEVNGQKIKWNRHKLITLMEIRTCVYCNRQYITNYKDETSNTDKTTADLDHFFIKSKYPFLALSLYNFIPSCQICNSRFKGDKFDALKHIYPYEEEFDDDGKFVIESKTLDYIYKGSSDFTIDLKYSDNYGTVEKIKKSVDTFKIREVYQTHKDYVREIFIKKMSYNDDAIEMLMNEFPKIFEDKDKNEVLSIVMGNYIEINDLSKRPLAKLTRDICEQYDIVYKNYHNKF